MYQSIHLTLNDRRRETLCRRLLSAMVVTLVASLLAGCGASTPSPTPTPPPLASELDFYDWAGYMPQSVLDAFTAEYGVKVNYVVYESQEDAEANMRAGKVYDVVVMGIDFIPRLVADGLLAEIDRRNVPNLKNISANFRDLTYDPGNKYSVLYEWSTTGLVYRTDLIKEPITRWTDLWNPRYAGKVGVWAIPRSMIGIALKSLGYSINSENPAELEAALKRLIQLKSNAFFLDLNLATSAPVLESGQAALVYGWPYDIMEARKGNAPISYVLPEEGTLLWGDNLVIPANSPNKYTAELFVNFILRPDISAKIVNEIVTATANEAARPFIDPQILNDPVIFPPDDALKNAEIILPLSPAGQKLYDDIWERFMAAGQ